MTPAPKYRSDSRVMEAHVEVKKEPAAITSLKEGGRLVKRKRALSESEQGQKRSHGVNSTSRAPSKTKSASKDNNAVNAKRKRPVVVSSEEVDPEMDSEHVMNAAQALFELFGGAGTSSQKGSLNSKSSDAAASPPSAIAVAVAVTGAHAGAGGVKWAGKKSRSSRSKKADDCACKLSSSSTTSATVSDVPEVLDSSTSHNHHVAAPHRLVAVNLEDESEADADAKSTDMSPCGLGLDRGQRLLSQSSVESTLLDSRAESPSSPLRVLKPNAVLIPKLEEELLLQFGFQKQAPVNKPSTLRKPKAEEICAVRLDELKEVKILLKQVQRRKPRASSLKGPPLLLQGDVLDVPIASSASVLKECIEENKVQVPVTLNLFEPVKLETERVKVEARELYQTGSSTQVRLRSALSEAEKEARRLRRVQANRESARQTIRRKQVLCEELARKAGELQAEKDNLALNLEAKSKELRNHQEMNRHLKEQIVAQATTSEAPFSAFSTSSNMASAPVPATTGAIQGMPMLPCWWFALAQSVAAAATSQSVATPSQMSCEPGVAAAAAMPSDFNAVFAATVAALNSGAGMSSNMWMGMLGNAPGNAAALDPKLQPTLAHSGAALTESSPPKLAGAGAGAGAGAAAAKRPSGRTPVQPGMEPQISQMNGKIPLGLPSNPNSRVKYQLTNNQAPSPLVRSFSAMTPQMPAMGDGMAAASTTLSLGLGGRSEEQLQMRKPGNLRFFTTIGNGVQGFLGPRLGTVQSEAAALATEARRRRRELKRTKSLQSQLQHEKKLASVKSL